MQSPTGHLNNEISSGVSHHYGLDRYRILLSLGHYGLIPTF